MSLNITYVHRITLKHFRVLFYDPSLICYVTSYERKRLRLIHLLSHNDKNKQIILRLMFSP
jgi:hypothetical protein